jgi:hypothetical protein
MIYQVACQSTLTLEGCKEDAAQSMMSALTLTTFLLTACGGTGLASHGWGH